MATGVVYWVRSARGSSRARQSRKSSGWKIGSK